MNKTLALLVRALRTESRDIKSHLFRVGLAGVVVLILLMGLSALQFESAPGRLMFKWMTWANWVFVTLAGGTFFSIAISEETEQQTLGLLRMANVSPLSLLLGKWLPRMLAAMVLISIQFPFTWLTVTLGGVSWQQIWASYLMLLAHLVLVGSLGLFSSVLNPNSAKACAMTFIIMIVARLLPAFCWAALEFGSMHGWVDPASCRSFSQEIVFPLNQWSASGRMWSQIMATSFQDNAWSPQVISNFAGGAVLFFVAWLIFDPATMRHMSGGPERKSLVSRLLTRKSRSSARAWSWALGWKDFRQVSGGLRAIVTKYALYGVLFGAILYINTLSHRNWRDEFETSCIAMAIILFWVILPLELSFLAAKLFRPELNDHTWSTLLTLPKSLPEIVYSKTAGAMLGLIPTVTVLCLSSLPFIDELLRGIFREPEVVLMIAYGLSVVLAALHLVTFFSITVSWAAWPIAIILGVGVSFFGNLLFWMMFGIGMMGIGGGGTQGIVEAWVILLTCGHCVLAALTHYGIGQRLIAKAAEN